MEVEISSLDSQHHRRHSTDSTSASSKSSQLPNLSDPGLAFERILDVVEEAGFDTIDAMAAHYYSATFTPNSTAWQAQLSSRSRHLRPLLRTLRKSARNWSKYERHAYEEETVRSATSVCSEELRVFRKGKDDGLRRLNLFRAESAPGCSSGSSRCSGSSRGIAGRNRYGTGTMDQLRRLLLEEEASQPTRLEKRLLRQCLPETWSLLSEFARSSKLPPAQASHLVYSFLYMTVNG